MYVICKNDYPIAVVATKELAEQNKTLIQEYYNKEKRLEKLRGESCWNQSYIHVHYVPELENTDFIDKLGLNKNLDKLLVYWEEVAEKSGQKSRS
ncbi:hypothetical protein IT084_15770 [Desulfallas sp. Bu1-1]|uniref:hypothetical protein n=1 Tax=Desulfallas sp. Bu1-1 TaxID=2787620 RepID=UPI00189D81DE|nr:hypothetical protein [Desulfallas sp. Bu1-1]MBF7084411.1 hypothetical protein [Desulfallas sp. Bu1-1]